MCIPNKKKPRKPIEEPIAIKPTDFERSERKDFKFEVGMEGVDISHWNDVKDLELVAANSDFIIMKATEGESFLSKTYLSRAEKLKGMDIAWGAYHYYRTNVPWKKQADHFLKYIDVNSGIAPVLDIEKINNKFKNNHTAEILAFLEYMEEKTGLTPIVYTGYYFFKDNIMPREKFKRYPLWIAWYRKDFAGVKCPEPWDNIMLWQYTEHGSIPGINGHVDLNRVMS